MTPLGLELRRSRSLVLALVVSLVAYGGIMGLMYPVLKESDEQLQAYMEMFPKEFLAAFGMTGSLADPGIFFTTYVASWLWPIVAAAAALVAGTRTVAADLERGFLDLPLATRISRTRYLATAIGAQAITMAILAASAVLGLWGAARLVGVDFDLGRFAIAGLLCFALGCAIAGPTTLGSVLTLSRGMTCAIVGGTLVVMYAMFVVTGISVDWAWIGPLTAWNHFPTTAVIDDGYLPAGDVALFGVIAVGCWLAAIGLFRRRDLAA